MTPFVEVSKIDVVVENKKSDNQAKDTFSRDLVNIKMLTKSFHEKTNFWWYDLSYDFILKFFQANFSMGNFINIVHLVENKSYFRYFVLKTLFQALYLEIKPLKSTMGA